MKKGYVLMFLLALMVNVTYAQKAKKEKKEKPSKEETSQAKEDAKKNKEETKRIKDELKNYMKHPEQYKAKMDGNQADKDTSDAVIARLKTDLKAAQDDEAELQKKITMGDEQTKLLQEENTKLTEAAAAAKDADMKSTPTTGTVYKVQLGMYRGFNMTKLFDQARYIGYENVDGMNRYVISYFPDQETALKFVADIRKLGVRDAFVAKYIDGVRVYEWDQNPKYKGKKIPDSLEEALGNKAKKGKNKKQSE